MRLPTFRLFFMSSSNLTFRITFSTFWLIEKNYVTVLTPSIIFLMRLIFTSNILLQIAFLPALDSLLSTRYLWLSVHFRIRSFRFNLFCQSRLSSWFDLLLSIFIFFNTQARRFDFRSLKNFNRIDVYIIFTCPRFILLFFRTNSPIWSLYWNSLHLFTLRFCIL